MSRVLPFERRKLYRSQENDSPHLIVRTLGRPETNIGQEPETGPKVSVVGTDGYEQSKGKVSTEQLYSVRDALSPELASALRLLAEGVEQLEGAIEAIEEEDIITADDALNRLDVLMPELFCCRSLGEGYGAIVNGVLHALRNRRQQPLNTIQIRTIWLTLKKLRSEPFISFKSALDLVEDLEHVGLNLDPPGFESMVEWIDE